MTTTSKAKRGTSRAAKTKRRAAIEVLPIDAIAKNLRGWADTVLGNAVPADRRQGATP